MELILEKDLIIDLPKLGIDFDLSSQQIECLKLMYQFVLPDCYDTFTLSGFPGTGKTTIVKIFLEILRRIGIREHKIALTAPTHRAKNVLEELSGREGSTIHSILSLSPNVDIEKLDMDNLKFDSKSEPTIPYKGVLICDESSMINDTLYTLMTDFCCQQQCKIIFLGDPDQLKPVKQNTISKVFLEGYGFQLTQIHRQKDSNPLGPIIADIRENIKTSASYPFVTNINEEGEGIEFVDFNHFLERMFEKFTSDFKKDDTKILCFTNDRVKYFNQMVREIRGYNDPVNKGDIILLYDSLNVGLKKPLANSTDYTVLSVQKNQKEIFGTTLDGYDLLIENEKGMKYSFYLLEPETPAVHQQNIALQIEEFRLQAIDNKKLWFLYFGLKDSFTSFEPLYHPDGRVIKSKGLDYGYAMTIHKVQGGTIQDIFIDLKDINRCQDPHLRNSLEYVSLSRTKRKAIVLR